MFGVDVRSIRATSDWQLSGFLPQGWKFCRIFADMWIEWEDSRPIAAVLYHLFSVLIYRNNLPRSFVGLLQFFCARGPHECSWRSMVKNIFWKGVFVVMEIDWAKRYTIADLAHGLNDKNEIDLCKLLDTTSSSPRSLHIQGNPCRRQGKI